MRLSGSILKFVIFLRQNARTFQAAIPQRAGRPDESYPDEEHRACPEGTFSIQRMFDKWFLPIVFVAIGSLIVWAIWRH